MRPRRGFTLLELVVVVGVVAAVSGLAAASAAAIRRRAFEDATVASLRRLGEAIHRYAEDASEGNDGAAALPPDLAHLVANGTGVPSWRGPYLSDRRVVLGPASGSFTPGDGWDRPIEYARLGVLPGASAPDATRAVLTSAGADGVRGTADDLVLELDVAPELRAETLRRLRTIEAAIRSWNEVHLYGPVVDPLRDLAPPAGSGALPTDWAQARARLVAEGYLEDDPRFSADAWGEPLSSDGYAPLWRVVSARF